MVLAEIGRDLIFLLIVTGFGTAWYLIREFVIGAAADERQEHSESIDEIEARLKAVERSCAKGERLEPKVEENQRRSKATEQQLEDLMRYLNGTDKPGDEGAIRRMHSSIEDVRSDVRDVSEQSEKIEREVQSLSRTNTDIAYSFHELVDAMRQIEGVDAPELSIREDYRERDRGDDRRPDGGVSTHGGESEMGLHEHEETYAYDWLDELKADDAGEGKDG